MHEYSFTESLLDLALDKARAAGAARITRLNLVLGEISGIVPECLQQYFEILRQDTIASGAALSFATQATTLKCRKCGRAFVPAGGKWDCPGCHESNVEIVAGRECYLESIEVAE